MKFQGRSREDALEAPVVKPQQPGCPDGCRNDRKYLQSHPLWPEQRAGAALMPIHLVAGGGR